MRKEGYDWSYTTIITPRGKLWEKNDKNGPKIDKNCAKIALFLYIFRSRATIQ